MAVFEFDVKFFASVSVEADNARDARQLLNDLDGASAAAGVWPNGDRITLELVLDGADLNEVRHIDGSAELMGNAA